jgi:hypothetical protein
LRIFSSSSVVLAFCTHTHRLKPDIFITLFLSWDSFTDVPPDRVLLNSPVVSVDYSASGDGDRANNHNGVVVKTLDGKEHSVACVVVASPLPTHNSIAFNPPVSARRRQLVQRVHMGMCVKAQIYYKKAFWRENGELEASV